MTNQMIQDKQAITLHLTELDASVKTREKQAHNLQQLALVAAELSRTVENARGAMQGHHEGLGASNSSNTGKTNAPNPADAGKYLSGAIEAMQELKALFGELLSALKNHKGEKAIEAILTKIIATVGTIKKDISEYKNSYPAGQIPEPANSTLAKLEKALSTFTSQKLWEGSFGSPKEMYLFLESLNHSKDGLYKFAKSMDAAIAKMTAEAKTLKHFMPPILLNPKPLPIHPSNNGDHFLPQFPNGMDPQTQKDFMAWLEAMEEMAQIKEQLDALLKELKSGKVKNINFAIQKVMGCVMSFGGAQMKALAAVDNVETDMRNLLGKAQSDYNAAVGEAQQNKGPDSASNKDMANFLKDIQQLQADVKFFEEYDKTAGKGHQIFDSSTLKNIQDAINSIKTQFGKDWGDPAKMSNDLYKWVNDKDSKNNLPIYSAELKSITDAFRQINQTVSALSTTTNTRLQYKTEQEKQLQATDESIIQSGLKVLATMIQNEKSN